MDRNPPQIPATMTVGELADRIARRDAELSRHEALLVVDDSGELRGIITRGDILRGLEADSGDRNTVLECGSSKLVVTYPDEFLSEAAHKMLRHDVGRLPVVERENPRRVVGYLGRSNIMAARLRRLEEEHVREPGWMSGARRWAAPPMKSQTGS